MTDSFDSIDREQLDDTVRSAGYALIRERIQAMWASKMRELLGPLDLAATAEVRGFLKGIEAVQRVPAILRAEMKRKTKRVSRR